METLNPKILTREQKKLWAKLSGAKWLEAFYLAGGTAIALYLGHRESADFDFFSERDFSSRSITKHLEKLGSLSIVSQEKDTLHGILDQVKISFFDYPYALLKPVQNLDRIAVASLEDIIPMKLIAISQRGTKKDFMDLFALLKSGWNLDAMFDILRRKFKGTQYNEMHILKSLVYFNDAEGDPDPRLLAKHLTWDMVKLELRRIVRKRF